MLLPNEALCERIVELSAHINAVPGLRIDHDTGACRWDGVSTSLPPAGS